MTASTVHSHWAPAHATLCYECKVGEYWTKPTRLMQAVPVEFGDICGENGSCKADGSDAMFSMSRIREAGCRCKDGWEGRSTLRRRRLESPVSLTVLGIVSIIICTNFYRRCVLGIKDRSTGMSRAT